MGISFRGLGCAGLLLVAVALPGAEPADVASNAVHAAYTSLYRASCRVLEDEDFARELWKVVDAHPRAFDEITVFSQCIHSIRSLDHHRRMAKGVPRFLAEARKRGLVAGVNVLCAIGFAEDSADLALKDMPWRRDGQNQHDLVGVLCPSDPRTLRYVEDQYEIYASARPDFIYVDDDVSCVVSCGCPRCRAMGPGDLQNGLYAAAVRGVRKVSASIGVGAMPCEVGGCRGIDTGRWSCTLLDGAAPGAEVRWRPGGGVWNDHGFDPLLMKLERCSAMCYGLDGAVVKRQAEIEHFPYQQLEKSPDFMGYEALMYLGWGMNGIAWNHSSAVGVPLADYEAYFAKSEAVRAAASRIVATLDGAPAGGVSFPYRLPRDRAIHTAHELAVAGLPVASDPAGACVVLLDVNELPLLVEADVRRILSGGVLMDIATLEALNAHGFGELTGFKVAGKSRRDAITRDLDHPLNRPGRHVRDLRAMFGHSYGRTADRGLPLLEKTSSAAEFTREAVDIEQTHSDGPTAGVFTNKLGGRVAVESLEPFGKLSQSVRAEDMKRLLRWLSHDTLPGYVASFHRAALKVRGRSVFLANVSTASLKDVEVALRDFRALRGLRLVNGCATGEFTLEPMRTDGPYSIYRIPELPHLGQVLLWEEK